MKWIPLKYFNLNTDRSRVRGPRGVESMEELDTRSLARSEDSRTIYYGRKMPTEKGRIFKVKQHVCTLCQSFTPFAKHLRQ